MHVNGEQLAESLKTFQNSFALFVNLCSHRTTGIDYAVVGGGGPPETTLHATMRRIAKDFPS